MNSKWLPDFLGDGFEYRYVKHPDDYSGEVRSAVVRLLPSVPTSKSVLYVHGFSDYYFQKEMAEIFVNAGYGFYAVDLRKYGRSLLPGQQMFQVRDLHEYFDDIDSSIDIIRSDGAMEIVVLGHSTGGLTASLYMSEHPSPMIRALILNSPFLDWNLPKLVRSALVPVVSALGRIIPAVKVHQKPDRGYAESLLSEYGGEWNYRRDWKPDVLPDPDMGWIRAIHTAQKALRSRKIYVPVLLMRSSESVSAVDGKEKYKRADAILDVDSISKYGRLLGDDVTEVAIDGALHDIALSPKSIRTIMYKTMLHWLSQHQL